MENTNNQTLLSAQPRFDQNAPKIQAYSTVNHLFLLELEESMRQEMTEMPQSVTCRYDYAS